jgi:hypothetical protein
MRHRLAVLVLAAAVILACSGLGTPAAQANPLDANAMWVWYVSASGGTPQAVAHKAKRHNIGTVLVKSGDAGNYWSQFSSSLVSELHQRGIRACAWQFVYGSSPVAEARIGARAVSAGADCLVIDAEGSYEGHYAAADRYISELRSRVGHDYPLGLAGFPYVDYHPSFPYSVFLGRRGAKWNVPQMYWHTIGTSVRHVYSHTYRFNNPYDRRIYPLGQTWQDPGRRQLTDFRKFGREYGAGGTSWWSWQETDGREWDWVGKAIHRGIPGFSAHHRFPALASGSRGDLVVLAQERLKAAGRSPGVDGVYGSKTARAVRRFQEREGLDVSGTIQAQTWRKLLRFEPVWVNWGKREKAANAPASASLPARGNEIPPDVGAR